MKMEMGKELKNANGVTLVALIVTLIVLAIITGIGISSAVGERGVISKTQEMKNDAETVQNQEDIIVNKILDRDFNYQVGGDDTEEIPTYTVTFCNWDGTELQAVTVNKGETAEYTGEEPTREEDDDYVYTFTNVWVTEKEGSIQASLDNINKDKTVYASFSYEEK